jgi:hypothetical protein
MISQMKSCLAYKISPILLGSLEQTRTLTNPYNERPAWLDHAHRALDEAVAEAYGWKADMPDDEMLAKLLALNLERASAAR